MEVKKISDQTTAIQERFFRAINALIESGKLAGMKTFCGEYGLHKAKYTNLRNAILAPKRETKYRLIDIEALHYLVKDYNVNANWLLTGRGSMFRGQSTFIR